jgi:hypothetical protein
MRKVFWSCAALAVGVAAALYLITEHYNSTARVVGRAVVTAGGMQASLRSTPAGGAEESSPIAMPNAMGVEVPSPASKGYIVVDGSGEVSGAPQGVYEPEARFDPTTIDLATLPGGFEENQAAPPVMPLCVDPNEAPPMPFADEEPAAEAEGTAFELWLGIFGDQGTVETPAGKCEESEQPAGCIEPASHYDHCPCCPYSGKPCYPCTPSVPEPMKKSGRSDEPSPDAQGPVKSVSRKMFESISSSCDARRPLRNVDTMECRPSDLGPYQQMPGSF